MILPAERSLAQEERPAKKAKKITAGYIEDVVIMPGNLRLRAKLDSGARTSSLNAPNYRVFPRKGELWVSFSVTSRTGRKVTLERKLVRTARIKRIRNQSQHRPVIMLGVCLGGVYQETQVNLVSREGFNFQMLVGRRFMRTRIIIDPGRTLLLRPVCTEAPEIDGDGAGTAAPDAAGGGR